MAEYTPDGGEVQELIVGLLLDAGGYVRHGQPDPGETLTWDQREVRAWRAARLLSERHAHDARVRRDAAREALGGVAAELMEAARDCAADGDHGGAGAWRNASAHTYHLRDTHYPETEDQT